MGLIHQIILTTIQFVLDTRNPIVHPAQGVPVPTAMVHPTNTPSIITSSGFIV